MEKSPPLITGQQESGSSRAILIIFPAIGYLLQPYLTPSKGNQKCNMWSIHTEIGPTWDHCLKQNYSNLFLSTRISSNKVICKIPIYKIEEHELLHLQLRVAGDEEVEGQTVSLGCDMGAQPSTTCCPREVHPWNPWGS